jgi:hypothetical protein
MGLFSVFTTNSGVIESDKLADDFSRILTDIEEIEVGFRLKEDTFIFTNKRLILVEKLKEDDKDIVYLTVPYSQISFFSVVSKKAFDSKASLKIFLSGQTDPVINKEFNKSVDVYEVQKILAGHVLK